jgi:cytoskeletal protein RodZ
MTDHNNVTWKWLVGILVLILMGGGGAWMTTMYAQVGKVQEEQKADRQTVNDVKSKVGIIEEQTKRTQKDVEEIKDGQKDTNKKLDELLRRR